MRTNRCHIDPSALPEVRVAGDRHRYPDAVPDQQAKCPVCRLPLAVRQGPAGPRWLCGCSAKAA